MNEDADATHWTDHEARSTICAFCEDDELKACSRPCYVRRREAN